MGTANPADSGENNDQSGASPSEPGRGAFRVYEIDCQEFNIEPRDDFAGPIPEEQREIAHGIYEAWAVLKALKDQKVFSGDEKTFSAFRRQLLEAARAGLEVQHARTRLAARALEQIRDEIALRKGVIIKLNYLGRLAFWGLIGILAIAAAPYFVPPALTGFVKYSWVIIGAIVGAWMSVAVNRQEVAFEEMPTFLHSRFEPLIRIAFVALLSVTLAILLELEIIVVEMAGTDFATFSDNPSVGLILGIFAGLSERAVSVRVIERAGKIFPPGSV